MKESNELMPVGIANRRPRSQSLGQYGDKSSLGRDCSSGSFVSKLYRMVDTEPSNIVSWIRGKSFARFFFFSQPTE
jgi:hypothetical protein